MSADEEAPKEKGEGDFDVRSETGSSSDSDDDDMSQHSNESRDESLWKLQFNNNLCDGCER